MAYRTAARETFILSYSLYVPSAILSIRNEHQHVTSRNMGTATNFTVIFLINHLAGDTVKVGVNGMVNIAEEYMGFVDEVNDAKLLALASERMAMADSSQFVPAERLYEELGITQDDLDTVGDVDIE